jgi:hypothetical protein
MFTYNYMFNKDILFQDKKISANLIFTTQLGFFRVSRPSFLSEY